jgi:hypothetical protein
MPNSIEQHSPLSLDEEAIEIRLKNYENQVGKMERAKGFEPSTFTLAT